MCARVFTSGRKSLALAKNRFFKQTIMDFANPLPEAYRVIFAQDFKPGWGRRCA